jgi:hypothetical protein
MTHRLRPMFFLMLAAVAALVLAACGSDDEPASSDSGSQSSEDVNDLLKQTFTNKTKIESGKLDITLGGDVKGVPQLSGPLSVKLSGPFQSSGGEQVPKFKLDIGFEGGGQSLELGATSTGDKGYVNFQGTDYELTDEVWGAFKKSYEQARKEQAGQQQQSLMMLGIDPQKWLTNPKVAGEEDVGGEPTTKITAGVDVARFVDDINVALEKAGAMGLSGTGQVPETLTDEQKRQVVEAVKSASVEIYTGNDDKVLRRIVIDADVVAPQGVDDFESADIKLDVSITELNQEQQIDAPANPKPFDELAEKLGGLGLGGLGANPSYESGKNNAPSTESLEKYSECVKDAGSDVNKAAKCADLLKKP